MPFNIFACLVHENFECVVDLLQNLRYFDPDSAIILYNGGRDQTLLPGTFPYHQFNAHVHPAPHPMHWGALHGFALDCIDFALSKLHFECITIVDSDQLLVRAGYSAYIKGFLSDKPEAGLLGISSERQTPDSGIYPVSCAYAEQELWQPLLSGFDEGERHFPHWTLWPSTVITKAAARAIHDSVAKNRHLRTLLGKTGITACEEILFPTLSALLGLRNYRNPCTYDFVKWNEVLTGRDVDNALSRLDAFWMHPIPRRFDNDARRQLRQRCNDYQLQEVAVRSGASTWQSTLHNLYPELAIVEATKHIEGWLSEPEAELLIAAVARLCRGEGREERSIVEIGSYKGKSTTVLGLAARLHERPVHIYAVDPFDGVVGAADASIDRTGATLRSFYRNIEEAELSDIVTAIAQKSYELQWSEAIDLLFIDGLHDYPNVARDFYHFADWITAGGLVAFHDYSAHYPGVRSFVNELLGSGDFSLLAQRDSLVVLEKGAPMNGRTVHSDSEYQQQEMPATNGKAEVRESTKGVANSAVELWATQDGVNENGISRRKPVNGRIGPTMHRRHPRPAVSIIIPVHNEGQRLFLTLEALRGSTELLHEIIVVDDDSNDGCCNFLREHPFLYENVRLVEAGSRQGVAGTRNFGAGFASAPILLFLDAHCFPRRGWLEKVAALFENSEVAIAAPCLTVAGNNANKGFGLTITQPDFAVSWLGCRQDEAYEVPMVGGGCMAVRSSFFADCGGFDAMNTFGVEDIELCLRAWLLGHSVMVEPRAEVAHWFKEHSNFKVDWKDYTYNLLRMASLHFDGERYERIMSSLAVKPAYYEALSALNHSDVADKRAQLRATRRYDADWFCRKFAIEI